MDLVNQILTYIGSALASMVQSIQGAGSTALGAVSNILGSITQRIGDSVAGLVNNIVPTITKIVSGVVENVSRFFEPLFDSLFSIISRIDSAIRQFLEPVLALVNRIIESVQETFGTFLHRIQDFISNAWERLVDVTLGAIESIQKFVVDVYSKVTAALQTAVSAVKGWIDSALASVTTFIRSAFNTLEQVYESIKGALVKGVQSVISFVSDAIKKVADLINAEWKKLVEGAESIIETVSDRIGDLAESFDKAAENLGESIAKLTEEQLAPFVEQVKDYVEFFKGGLEPEAYEELSQSIAQAIAPGTLALRGSEGFQRFFQSMLPSGKLARAAFIIIFGVMTTWGVYRGVVDANAQVILQEFGKLHPYQIMSAPDVIAAYRRGNASQEKVIETIRAGGFTPEDAVLMIKNSETPPPPGDLIAYWLRGILSEQALETALGAHGLTGHWVGLIKQAAEVIPPVSDLVTMAVREAFSPEIAGPLGQFDEFPEAFAEEAKKHGLTPEWARRYWAAHWSLPSATQGFEMVHREVISEEKLGTLLKALDVMPGWRAPLEAITYNTLTRVDVRRMHQLGVLDEDAVNRAHRHMGYNERDAALLTQFVLKLNKRAPGEDDEELGRLTRGSILDFYADGLIRRDRAKELLIDAGQTAEAAELYLASQDLNEARAERKAEADHIIALAQAGTITYNDANDRLNRLGLETLEVQRALAKLARLSEQKTKLPTQDDGEKLYVGGFVSRDDYAELLDLQGYPPKWVRAYLSQADEKRQKLEANDGRGATPGRLG